MAEQDKKGFILVLETCWGWDGIQLRLGSDWSLWILQNSVISCYYFTVTLTNAFTPFSSSSFSSPLIPHPLFKGVVISLKPKLCSW